MSKAYRLYDPVSKQVVTRRDVIFDESKLDIPKTTVDQGSDNSKILSVDLSQSNSENQVPQLRKSQRTIRPPCCYSYAEYGNYAVYHASNVVELQLMNEAKSNMQSHVWLSAAEIEYQALMDSNTWTLTELPPGRLSGCSRLGTSQMVL